MNTKFEQNMHGTKESKGKVSMLVNENRVLSDQLKDIEEETTSLSSQVDYLEWNLKGKNLEVIVVHFLKNENVIDLAVKAMINIDPQLSEEDIDSAKSALQ